MSARCKLAALDAMAPDGSAGPRVRSALGLRQERIGRSHVDLDRFVSNDTVTDENPDDARGSRVGDAAASALLFTPLELLVIGVGARDRAARAHRESRLARLGRLLFGIEAPTPFADARLEALRSLAFASKRGGRRAERAIAAARAAGITHAQIEQLVSTVRGNPNP